MFLEHEHSPESIEAAIAERAVAEQHPYAWGYYSVAYRSLWRAAQRLQAQAAASKAKLTALTQAVCDYAGAAEDLIFEVAEEAESEREDSQPERIAS